jgi:hypothetical protein
MTMTNAARIWAMKREAERNRLAELNRAPQVAERVQRKPRVHRAGYAAARQDRQTQRAPGALGADQGTRAVPAVGAHGPKIRILDQDQPTHHETDLPNPDQRDCGLRDRDHDRLGNLADEAQPAPPNAMPAPKKRASRGTTTRRTTTKRKRAPGAPEAAPRPEDQGAGYAPHDHAGPGRQSRPKAGSDQPRRNPAGPDLESQLVQWRKTINRQEMRLPDELA